VKIFQSSSSVKQGSKTTHTGVREKSRDPHGVTLSRKGRRSGQLQEQRQNRVAPPFLWIQRNGEGSARAHRVLMSSPQRPRAMSGRPPTAWREVRLQLPAAAGAPPPPEGEGGLPHHACRRPREQRARAAATRDVSKPRRQPRARCRPSHQRRRVIPSGARRRPAGRSTGSSKGDKTRASSRGGGMTCASRGGGRCRRRHHPSRCGLDLPRRRRAHRGEGDGTGLGEGGAAHQWRSGAVPCSPRRLLTKLPIDGGAAQPPACLAADLAWGEG
jgi:hypothetical protein